MKAGAPRTYTLFMLIEMAIFTAGVLLKDFILMVLFFAVLLVGVGLFYGRDVRVEKGRIKLEWGLLFKREREITSAEILDIIDVPSSRYLVLAGYLPEVLLIPAGMVTAGALIFMRAEYGWVGLLWIYLGLVELVNYLSSMEGRKLGAGVVLLVAVMLALIGYLRGADAIVPIALFGFLTGAILWEGGPVTGNTILLVTEKGIYSVNYTSTSELKDVISALGGGNEG